MSNTALSPWQVTGLLRPRYNEWGGAVRNKMLQLIDEYGGAVALFAWYAQDDSDLLIATSFQNDAR
eukprot:2156472-Rhodomonas_salina.10